MVQCIYSNKETVIKPCTALQYLAYFRKGVRHMKNINILKQAMISNELSDLEILELGNQIVEKFYCGNENNYSIENSEIVRLADNLLNSTLSEIEKMIKNNSELEEMLEDYLYLYMYVNNEISTEIEWY